MTHSIRPLAKGAIQELGRFSDVSRLIRELAQFLDTKALRPGWLADVRAVLGLRQHELAAAMGTPLSTFTYWEKDARRMQPEKALALKAFLLDLGLDSKGRMLAAKAVG